VRLLYVSHSFPPDDRPLANLGGMQRVAVELHAALARCPGIEIEAMLLRSSWSWTHVRMVPFGVRLLLELPRRVAAWRADAVLFSSMVTGAFAPVLASRLRARGCLTAAIVLGREVTLPNPLYRGFIGRALRALDLALPISGATAAACVARGVPPAHLTTVPCGIDPGRFANVPTRMEARSALLAEARAAGRPLPHDALLLCSVGRHVERKGFAWFATEVLPRLPPHVCWLLGGDGPLTRRLANIIGRNGLAGRVRMLGRLPENDLLRLYRAADLFVMPNLPVPGDLEGFGVVLLEAATCELPIVAASVDGIVDAVTTGTGGRLVPAGDAAAWAAAILEADRRRGDLARAGRETGRLVRDTFSWSRIAGQYAKILESRVTGRPAADSWRETA
jgi:phosphatidyl-myo-inositol dimannoside synthase